MTDRFEPVRNDIPQMDLREVILIFWRSRWLIASIVLLGALMGLAAAVLLQKKYTATILLSPVTQQSSGALGAIGATLSQLSGGVASLAGLSLGQEGGAKAEAIATLQSEALTTRYIRDNNLLPLLFSDRWDAAHNTWEDQGSRKPPSLWQGNAFFADRVRKVTESAKTGLVTMTITWSDPEMAARWANGVVGLANEYLRDRAIEESRRNITYLEQQAAKTNVVELRNAIYALMEAEIKKEMLARGSGEYALKVIDPAVAPELPSFPRLILLVAAGIAGGLFLGAVIAALMYFFRQDRRTAA